MNQGAKVLFMYVVVEPFQFWITHHLWGVHLIMYDIVNSNKLYIYKKRIRVKQRAGVFFPAFCYYSQYLGIFTLTSPGTSYCCLAITRQ